MFLNIFGLSIRRIVLCAICALVMCSVTAWAQQTSQPVGGRQAPSPARARQSAQPAQVGAPQPAKPSGAQQAAQPARAGVYLRPDVEPAQGLFAAVIQDAEKRASKDYKDPARKVPDFLLALNMNDWQQIRFKEEYALWLNEGLPFEARFFHPGNIFNRAVTINVVEGEAVSELEFSPDMFKYGEDFPLEKLRQSSTGFAGLSLVAVGASPENRRDVAQFLGASYFQSSGKNAAPGVTARGIALNTATPGGEEFPYFKEFWLLKPKKGDTSITLFALLDSPSMSGAYRFIITPGTSTVMDVECRLFLRKGSSAPQKIGLAGMNSMFVFAEYSSRPADDYRPEVHNSDGLLYRNGENEFVWRPLTNPARLSVQGFSLRNPRGFGLLQRDNKFDHYLDINRRYDRCGSIWVEPQGNWGEGTLELVEIPTKSEIHNNINAYWVPATPAPETAESATQALSLAYRLYWMDPGVTPHALGRAAATHIAHTAQDSLTFVIDFEGEALKAIPADTGLTSVVETPEQVQLIEKHLAKNPATGGWRLTFKVRRPAQEGVVQSIISAREGAPRPRFRALLKKGENLPDALTEIWVYDLP